MAHPARLIALVIILALSSGQPAHAGMPMVSLTEIAHLRLEAISFFLACFLASSWLVYKIWNAARKDFPQLPHLSYRMVTGLVCLVVLTAGLHLFLSWFHAQWRSAAATAGPVGDHWRIRWTAWIIGTVLLMFVAGLATVGVTHQTGWLLASGQAIVGNSSSSLVRRVQSASNLKQMGLGLHGYLDEHDSFPPAATFGRLGRPIFGWQAMILPYIEHPEIFDKIDFGVPWDDPKNAMPYGTEIQAYVHPGIERRKNAAGYALSHYAASAPMLGGGASRTLREVPDGAAGTIMAGEIVANFKPWGDPTNWRDPGLGLNRSPLGFGGPSPGGVNFLFADGSVRFLRNTIDLQVLRGLSTPDGGEKISELAY